LSTTGDGHVIAVASEAKLIGNQFEAPRSTKLKPSPREYRPASAVLDFTFGPVLTDEAPASVDESAPPFQSGADQPVKDAVTPRYRTGEFPTRGARAYSICRSLHQ
jgi:hypothetical protein